MNRFLQRHFTPFGNPWAVASESLLLPLLAVGLGIWLNPIDPLWTHGAFPWAWFAPAVLAMRYGPFPGMVGGGVLVAAWLAFNLSGWLPGEFPKLNFLGGLILVMLCGEFSSLWLARARRAEGTQLYLDQRLDYLTHQYYLLRLSHDRLEQDLMSRPMAMRDALGTLRRLTAAGDPQLALPGAKDLLELLAQYCQLEAAALHAAEGEGFAEPPAATLGRADNDGRLVLRDPLVAYALEKNCLAHVAQIGESDEDDSQTSRYVVVAPLKLFDGQRIGLLTVSRLPFFALHEETLQTINLLLGYYADSLSSHRLAAAVQAAHPACPGDFAAELQRLARVHEESGIDSIMVALEFLPRAKFDDLAATIHRQRRALDITWLIEDDERKILIILMPLVGQAAAEGYLARITDWLRQQREVSLDEAGVLPHILPLSDQTPADALERMLDICHVSAQVRSQRADA